MESNDKSWLRGYLIGTVTMFTTFLVVQILYTGYQNRLLDNLSKEVYRLDKEYQNVKIYPLLKDAQDVCPDRVIGILGYEDPLYYCGTPHPSKSYTLVLAPSEGGYYEEAICKKMKEDALKLWERNGGKGIPTVYIRQCPL